MLKITIEGLSGEGKTTLACEIEALLESLNMNVRVTGEENNESMADDDVHQGRVEAMGGKTVWIETMQIRKGDR